MVYLNQLEGNDIFIENNNGNRRVGKLNRFPQATRKLPFLFNMIKKVRGKDGRFVNGHLSIGGFKQGHPCYGGCEKGWFKKGIIPKTAFKKGNTKGYRYPSGNLPWNTGTKGVVKAWNKGLKGYLAGDKNPGWKGGITPEFHRIRNSPEMIAWRNRVFKRDNFVCQSCYKKGGNLEAHHIKGFAAYPELRLMVSNGITLHRICHLLVHCEERRAKALDMLTGLNRQIDTLEDRKRALTQQIVMDFTAKAGNKSQMYEEDCKV